MAASTGQGSPVQVVAACWYSTTHVGGIAGPGCTPPDPGSCPEDGPVGLVGPEPEDPAPAPAMTATNSSSPTEKMMTAMTAAETNLPIAEPPRRLVGQREQPRSEGRDGGGSRRPCRRAGFGLRGLTVHHRLVRRRNPLGPAAGP